MTRRTRFRPPDRAAAIGGADTSARVFAGLANPSGHYLYLELGIPQPVTATALEHLQRISREYPAFAIEAPSCHRLVRMFEPRAASAGGAAPYRYVVETDAAAGWSEELFRWYDDEHMPGLAGVPGCVRAQRYVNLDAGPRSHACYDLVRPQTTQSPEWLAVRATAWSERVRPQFRNTRRTMFRALGA